MDRVEKDINDGAIDFGVWPKSGSIRDKALHITIKVSQRQFSHFILDIVLAIH
jgi:hypothetical protein